MSKRFRHILCALPPWILTAVTVVLILWLTLAPRPFGDIRAPLFPGADKIVHSLMFGFLTAMICADRARKDRSVSPSHISSLFALVSAAGASLFGVAIEFLQHWLGIGRSFETADIIADCSGAFIFAALWLIIQPDLSPSDNG